MEIILECIIKKNIRQKMGIAEKIKDIEIEMARTQKNKATEYHIGLLRARLCKLRSMAAEGAAKAAAGSGKGEGFDV